MPQLEADYILVQPDVMAQNWRRGWMPVGGRWGSKWDLDIYLNEQVGLDVAEIDGDAVLFAYPGRLSFEQTGTFAMDVVVSEG